MQSDLFKEGCYYFRNGRKLRCEICGSDDFDFYGCDEDKFGEYDEYQCRECLSFTKVYEPCDEDDLI